MANKPYAPFKFPDPVKSTMKGWVIPGGDNYYIEPGRQYRDNASWRPAFTSQLDCLYVTGSGAFQIEMQVNLVGNLAGVLEEKSLQMALDCLEKSVALDTLDKTEAIKNALTEFIGQDTALLISVRQVDLETVTKIIDRAGIYLYTKMQDDGGNLLDAPLRLDGTKVPLAQGVLLDTPFLLFYGYANTGYGLGEYGI